MPIGHAAHQRRRPIAITQRQPTAMSAQEATLHGSAGSSTDPPQVGAGAPTDNQPVFTPRTSDEDEESDVDEQELLRLRLRREKRMKKQELKALRRELDQEMEDILPGTQDQLPKRPLSADYSLEGSKHLRPTPPEWYDGKKGQKGLQSFLNQLETYFDAAGVPDEASSLRVRTAAARLKDEALSAYLREKSRLQTYDDFKDFLKGTIQNPQSRIAAATLKLQSIRQRADQSAMQVQMELEAARAEIPADMTQEVRNAWALLNALHPSLRSVLVERLERIESVDQVLLAAQKHEDARELRQTVRAPPPSSRRDTEGPQAPHKPAAFQRKAATTKVVEKKFTSSREQNRSTLHKERKATGACYTCGSLDHQMSWHDKKHGDNAGSVPAKK